MERIKTILAICGLLAIGFISGFVAHRQLVKKEMQRVVRLGEAPMFRQHLIRVLKLNPEQKQQVEAILDQHVQEMRTLVQGHRTERSKLVQQLEKELSPLLDEDQLQKLQHFNRRFKRPPPGAGRPEDHPRGRH